MLLSSLQYTFSSLAMIRSADVREGEWRDTREAWEEQKHKKRKSTDVLAHACVLQKGGGDRRERDEEIRREEEHNEERDEEMMNT